MSSLITNVPIRYEWPFTEDSGSEIPVKLRRGRNPGGTSYVGSGERQYDTHRSQFSVELRSPKYGGRSALGSLRDPVNGFTVVLPKIHDDMIEPHKLEFTYDPEDGTYYHDLPTRLVTGVGQKFGDGKVDPRVGVPLTQDCELEVTERLIWDPKTAEDSINRDGAKLAIGTVGPLMLPNVCLSQRTDCSQLRNPNMLSARATVSIWEWSPAFGPIFHTDILSHLSRPTQRCWEHQLPRDRRRAPSNLDNNCL